MSPHTNDDERYEIQKNRRGFVFQRWIRMIAWTLILAIIIGMCVLTLYVFQNY